MAWNVAIWIGVTLSIPVTADLAKGVHVGVPFCLVYIV